MQKSPPSTAHDLMTPLAHGRCGGRALALSLVLALAAIGLAAKTATAGASDSREPDVRDSRAFDADDFDFEHLELGLDPGIPLRSVGLEASSPLALALQNDQWRQRGLAYIDLPLGIRARVDANYTRHLYPSDVLAQRYLSDMGPEILGDRTLESRIALSRALGHGVELEIAWETRNSLTMGDPMGFGRQTVGARIRISP